MPSVIVRLLVLLVEVPVRRRQLTSTAWAPNEADRPLSVPNRLPLCIDLATFLGLPAKVGLDGLDGPRRPEQHPDEQTGQHNQADRLDGHRALR